MKIGKETHVSLTYELRLDSKENEIIEATSEQEPLAFTWGIGMMLPKFEQNIENLSIGDTFEFLLKAEEAYGKTSAEYIVDVPIEHFMKDGVVDNNLVKENNIIPVTMQNGQVMNARVDSFNDKTVRMDFNHPLADKDLYFTGKILTVREATEDEMCHGSHGCGDEHECCNCGNH